MNNFEIAGNSAKAIVYASDVEEKCLIQIKEILNNEFLANEKIRIMSDCHAGNNICIGFTSTMNGWAVPMYIGVDIGCGVAAHQMNSELDFNRFDGMLRRKIPSGMSVHSRFDKDRIKNVYNECFSGSFHEFMEEINCIVKKYKLPFRDDFYVAKSIGTLGGGNHFIEINQNREGSMFLTIHSGSRNFGLKIANHFQKNVNDKGYLEGDVYDEYVYAMELAQKYAMLNRRAMLADLIQEFDNNKVIESVHNYIDLDSNIIRKGAISARKGEQCLIPINMADGTLLCEGKGNEDWNCSAPHGAGRLMGRNAAKKTYSLAEYEARMKESGVWSKCINQETLDESPMAYKTAGYIKEHIQDSVDIIDHWKTVYNFKASE